MNRTICALVLMVASLACLPIAEASCPVRGLADDPTNFDVTIENEGTDPGDGIATITVGGCEGTRLVWGP